MIRFGIIGLGIGGDYIAALRNLPSAKVYAICDKDPRKLKRPNYRGIPNDSLLEGLSIPIVTTDYRDIVNCKEIDAVVVASPDHFHSEHVIELVITGKYVLCEKPLALTLEDCKRILNADHKAGKKVFVGQVCRYAPGFKKTKELIEKGIIGDLFFVESEYAHDYSHFVQIGNWRRDPDLMRYPFIGGACHAVDLLRWYAGDPTEVFAYGNQKCLTDWPKIMDAMIAIYKFPNEVIGKVFCSIGCKRPYTMRTVLYGSKGTIVCDNTNPIIKLYSEQLSSKEILGDSIAFTEIEVPVSNHNFISEVEDFIDGIERKEAFKLNPVEGSKTVLACVSAVESAKKSEKIKIDYDLMLGDVI